MEKVKRSEPYEYRHIYYVNKSFFISNATYTKTPISNIHFHNGYEIILVTQGSYKMYSPQRIYEGNGPCLGFFKMGTYHGCVFCECEETPATRFVINYTREFIEQIPEHMLDTKELFENDVTVIPLDNNALGLLMPFFNELYINYQKSRKTYSISPQIYTYMAVILNTVTEILRSKPAITVNMCGDNDNYIYDVIREILSTDKTVSPAVIAERHFISQSKLSDDFKRITGMNVKQMIDVIRLERIKKMLCLGTSNKEIVEQFGFSSESYFIQFFKNHMHISPGDYRKLNASATK